MIRLPVVLPLVLTLTACASAPAAMAPGVAPAPDLGARRVEMLVATTRRASPDANEAFTGERAEAISLQRVVVSVPPDASRAVGQIQWPAKAPGNPATDFVTQETTPIASDRQAIDWFRHNRGPKRRVLVFVHGFNTSYSEAVFRLAQISQDSGVDATPVLFTWPSRGDAFDYLYDKESATYSRRALEDVLRQAAVSPDVGDVTVLAHSMGAWLAVEALRGIAMRDKTISAKISNVVLASPDIDVDVFRRQVIEMGARRPHVTIFTSGADKALALSSWLSGDVARLGATDLAPYADDLSKLGITVIDTSAAATEDPLAHNAFAESPEMVRLLGRRLVGQDIGASRGGLTDRVGRAAATVVSPITRNVLFRSERPRPSSSSSLEY